MKYCFITKQSMCYYSKLNPCSLLLISNFIETTRKKLMAIKSTHSLSKKQKFDIFLPVIDETFSLVKIMK